jgi:Zn-dependent protease with chaperone function
MSRILSVAVVLLLAASALAQNAPLVPPDAHITAYSLPADKLAKATSLFNVEVRLLIIDTIYGFVILALFLYGRLSARFRDISERAIRNRAVQAVIFAPLFLIVYWLLNLPLRLYGHHVSMSYGLSIQQWPSWFADRAKSLAIELVVGTLIIMAAYWLMRRSPRNWWFHFWLISVPFVIFGVFIQPMVIDPLYNNFTPLAPKHPQLVSEIEKVTQHGGLPIPRDRMYEMDASSKVTTLNAYVTGIGASKRVVVWDNTSRELTIPQTLYVFGHEMGHYVLNHIWKGLAFTLVVMFIVYYLAARFGRWMIDRWGPRWGIRTLDDYASFPALLLVVSLFLLVTGPILSGYSRHLEHQADIYGLEVIHGIVPEPNQVAAQAFQALGENSYDYPDASRLLIFWTYDHPSIPDRLQFVLRYDPWSKGEQPKYVK